MDRATKTKIEMYTYDITVGSGEIDPERAPWTPDTTAYRELEILLGHDLLPEEKRYFKKCYNKQLMSLTFP